MPKNLVRLFVFLILVAWQVLMPITSAEAMSVKDGIPIKGPNGESWYLVPFSRVEPTTVSNDFEITATSGCSSFTKGIYIVNSVGQTIGRYAQKIDWCYNGSTVTSKSRIRWGEVYIATLQFNGHIGNTQAGGVGYTYYRAWTQGSFCWSVPGVGCVWYAYPWVDQYVYGNGSYWGDAGG